MGKIYSDNILNGLSGRKLKIPTKWKNPSEIWHLGLKSHYKPLTSWKVKTFSAMNWIVWFNGKKWLAFIDTFDDLENAKIITNFRDEYEYGVLSYHFLNQSYCISKHEEANLLQIFLPYYNHGSVVARVAAAYFPNESERDGLAPGAQIISMNVMDPTKRNLPAMPRQSKKL